LNEKVFSDLAPIRASGAVMTIQGAVNKTAILLALALLTAGWTWNAYFSTNNPASVAPYILVGAIGGFIVAIVTVFKKEWAAITAPIYALLEGLLLGGVSAIFEAQYEAIVIQAVGLTFGTLAALLFAYKAGIIRATPAFRRGVIAATGAIFLFYLVSIVIGFFGISMPLLHSSGPLGIALSLGIVIVAALNLVLDFDLIEQGAAHGAPKYMEWYSAFALMVTLVWLYLEILRLLEKTRRR
jgi:uncharacterized YccA/Bax inhibitor family protein